MLPTTPQRTGREYARTPQKTTEARAATAFASANKKDTFEQPNFVDNNSVLQKRPFTHEGRGPIPPSTPKKKSFRALSTRHITIGFEESESINLLSNPNTAEPSLVSQTVKADPTIIAVVLENREVVAEINEDILITEKERDKSDFAIPPQPIPIPWAERFQSDLLTPSFIKPTTRSSNVRHVTAGGIGNDAANTTRYPSLSHRLKASISTDPNKVVPKNPVTNGVTSLPIANATPSKGRPTTAAAFNPGVVSGGIFNQFNETDNFSISQPQSVYKSMYDNDSHYHPVMAGTTEFRSHSPTFPTQPNTTHNAAITTVAMTQMTNDESVAGQSTIDFDSMGIEDMLHYLLGVGAAEGAGHANFIHVTPRHHIDRKIVLPNFYDLVILERPGYPTSGYVWTRETDRYLQLKEKTLPKHHIMQLSIYGLLVAEENADVGELVSIQELFIERNLFDHLRNDNRYFKYFFHVKYFRLWKQYVKHTYFTRMKKQLLFNSFYSNPELVESLLYVKKMIYYIDQEIDFFHFLPPGYCNIMKFMELQINSFGSLENKLTNHLNSVKDFVQEQYQAYIMSPKLLEQTEEIRKHHPSSRKQELNAYASGMSSTNRSSTPSRGTQSSFSPQNVLIDNILATQKGDPSNAGFTSTGVTRPNTAATTRPTTARTAATTVTFNTTAMSTDNDENNVDWVQIRSIQRIYENYQSKVARLFIMTQFCMESTIASLLQKFWFRMKQLVLGIPKLKQKSRADVSYVWELEKGLFDEETGKLVPTAFDEYYKNMITSMKLQEEEDLIEEQQESNSKASPKKQSTGNKDTIPAATDKHKKVQKEENDEYDHDHDHDDIMHVTKESVHAGESPDGMIMEELDEEEKFFVSMMKLKESQPIKSVNWVNGGCHLGVEVYFYYQDHLLEVNDLLHLTNVDGIKIKVIPNKPDLTLKLHQICHHLGNILSHLPNFKAYSQQLAQEFTQQYNRSNASAAANTAIGGETGLIGDAQGFLSPLLTNTSDKESFKEKQGEESDRFGTFKSEATLSKPLDHSQEYISHNYFTLLTLFPTYNSKNAYNLALETIYSVQTAFTQAVSLDNYIIKLSEIVRKLWSLTPTILVKQLERSFIIPKIRDYLTPPIRHNASSEHGGAKASTIHHAVAFALPTAENASEFKAQNTIMIDDLLRSQVRDQNRVILYQHAIEYLEKLTHVLQPIMNLKHSNGLITSFSHLLEQLYTYKCIQYCFLNTKLTNVYNIRCTSHYEFIRQLESLFDYTIVCSEEEFNQHDMNKPLQPTGQRSNLNAGGSDPLGLSTYTRDKLIYKRIDLLQKIKAFEEIRIYCDKEAEISDYMYQVTEKYSHRFDGFAPPTKKSYFTSINRIGFDVNAMFTMNLVDANERMAHEIKVEKILESLNISRSTFSRSTNKTNQVTPEKLYRTFHEGLDRLSLLVANSKAYLLSSLMSMKYDLLHEKDILQSNIQTCQHIVERITILPIDVLSNRRTIKSSNRLDEDDEEDDEEENEDSKNNLSSTKASSSTRKSVRSGRKTLSNKSSGTVSSRTPFASNSPPPSHDFSASPNTLTKKSLASTLLLSSHAIQSLENHILTLGKHVSSLRFYANEHIAAQYLMLIAHDIVGAASAAFSAQEVDQFPVMSTLELLYEIRYTSWYLLQQSSYLMTQLQLVKFPTTNTVSNFATMIGNQNKLSSHDSNVKTLLQELCTLFLSLVKLMHNLQQKIERCQTLLLAQKIPRGTGATGLHHIDTSFSQDGSKNISDELKNLSSYHEQMIQFLYQQLLSLQPQIELISCLFNQKALKARHWMKLNPTVMLSAGYELKFSGRQNEFISVVLKKPSLSAEINNAEQENDEVLGSLYRLQASQFLNRGLEDHIGTIKDVTSEAVIENILETTLDCVEWTLRHSMIQLSGQWMKPTVLRNKLLLDLSEVVNFTSLGILSQYVWKAIIMIENTAQDMSVRLFAERIEKYKDGIIKFNKFLSNFQQIQSTWYYLFIVLKFTPRNELEREMIRMYYLCTEEMKKMEMVLHQKNGNLYSLFLGNDVNFSSIAASNETSHGKVLKTASIDSGHNAIVDGSAAAKSEEPLTEKSAPNETINLDSLKLNLSVLAEDMHSIVQSLLDGCPRFSLLSYHQLAEMLKIWLIGPQLFIEYFSQCMQQLFEGVGELHFVIHSAQIPLITGSNHNRNDESNTNSKSENVESSGSMHSYVCIGFQSRNSYESIHFTEAIPCSPMVSLDEFVTFFELQLRKTMCKQCDIMVVHRIHCIQGLFADNSLQQILTSLESLFSIRINSLQSKLSNDILNAVYLLMNQVGFSEDVWTCLGHPTGCFTIVRRDLMIESSAFQNSYMQSLKKHSQIIQETIVVLQDWLRITPTLINNQNGVNSSGTSFSSQGTISYAKQKALFTALLLQEISFLRILDELMTCSCLESCLELWAGHYQLKFQYDQQSRYNYCPIEVTMGNISLPYGMEYTGSSTVSCMTKEMEYALNRALSSAFSSRGTTIINTATSVNAQGINTTSIGSTTSNTGLPTLNGNNNFGDSNSSSRSSATSTFYSMSESSVTGKDIANALGRICTTLSSCSNSVHVRFFFARIVYLDAIGCIDFTTLNEYHLQILVQVAQTFWSILENKNDQYIQDSLKFPIKTKFLKNEIYSERKKRNLIQLRNLINWKKTQKFYISFILIGFASEVQFVNMKVFDQFYRSIFDSVSIPMRAPLSDLGVLLSCHGFFYGMSIQTALLQSIHSLVSNSQLIIPFNSGVYGLPGSSLAGANNNMVNIQYTLQLEDMRKLFPMKNIVSLLKACQHSLEIYPFTKYYQQYVSAYPSLTTTSNAAEAAAIGGGSGSYTTREKITRFKLEVICFLSNFWCYLIHQCYMNTEMLDCIESIITIYGNNSNGSGGNYDTHTSFAKHELIQYLVLLYTKLFEVLIHQLSQFMQLPNELDEFFQNLLQSYQINHVFTLNKTVQNCLVQATNQLGYISNAYFLQSCGLFWEQLHSSHSSVHVLSGEVYIGKTAILNTVLSGMDILASEMQQKQLEYAELQEEYNQEMRQLQGNSNGTFITPWNRHDYQTFGNKDSNKMNSFLTLTTTFHNIQLWKVSSLPVQCVIAARKITKSLQLWTAYCKYQKQKRDQHIQVHKYSVAKTTKDPGLSRTVTFGGSSQQNSIPNPSMRGSIMLSTPSKAEKKNSSILKSPASSSKVRKTLITNTGEPQTGSDMTRNREDAKLKPVTTHQTTIIYHASLTLQYLIGCYENGKWMDGLLLRKLRMLQEHKSNTLENSLLENKINSFWSQYTTITPLQLIVLTGPITYHIESLFHAMYFESTLMGLNYSFPTANNFLTFPTGEYVNLPSHVKLIIETSDLRNASPSCLSMLPVQTVSYPIAESYERILSVWMRSVFHWLGDFMPWLEYLDELNFIFFRTKFISDLLHSDLQYYSQTKSSIAVGLIQSRISGFLRLLEELLLQVHELALVNAIFSIPDESDEIFNEASSDDENATTTNNKKVRMEEVPPPPSNTTSPSLGSVGDGSGKSALISDMLYPGLTNQNAKKYQGVMSLSIPQRELLIHRARLALVYAATWGIGGQLNSTDRRKFFDNILRDLAQQVFDSSHKNYQLSLNNGGEAAIQSNKLIELNIASDCLLFDCILDIPECCIKPALQYNMQSLNSRLNDLTLPERFQDIHVFGELIHHPSQAANRDYLVFRSIGTRAVTAAFKLLLSSGSNICLFGQKGCGKTRLITEVLADFKQNCPTPDDIREQIMNNLINIVNGTDIPQGIFQAIEKLKSVLHDAAKLTTNKEVDNDFYALWYDLGRHLQMMWSDSARKHCRNKTVSSSTVSLRSLQGAHDLRYWMKREFSTETVDVLETSRFTYGVAFVDDMHCLEDFDALQAAQKLDSTDIGGGGEVDDQLEQEKRDFAAAFGASKQNTRLDRHEALLKGLLHGYPPFALQRNLVVRNPIKLGYSNGYVDSSFPRQLDTIPPILHREMTSDMRITSSFSSSANSEVHDNYVMNRLGIIAAVTGHSLDFRTNTSQNTSALATLLNQFACLSLPSFTFHELHVAMIVGAFVSMTSGSTLENLTVMNMLQAEIIELSRVTMITSSKIVSTADVTLTTLLERTVRASILLEISLINRFCMSLRYGCNHVKNPGGLLQLYSHEWKRFFIDPLPNGSQRDRVINLFHEQLDILDEVNWKITRDWVQSIKDDLSSFVDRVWVNTTVFKSSKMSKYTGGAVLARETMLAKPTDLLDASVIPKAEGEVDTKATAANKQELYVPVEFDIVGMEKFLSSGAFNRFTNTYDPVLTPQQITGGSRVHRTIHIEEHLTNDEVHSLLFPAALSLLLRIVRILSVTGKHVLLAGYSGSSRNRAILLAAKICDLEPRLFSIKEYNDVVESNPSEKAMLAMNFRHFIKTLVLRSCGLSDPITADDPAAANLSVFVASGQIVFQSLTISPSLVIVDGAQQLTTDDRYMLLQVLDYDDPSILFSDAEILGIGDALRKRQEHGAFVISLKESFLQSGTSHATEFNPLVTVVDPLENEVTFAKFSSLRSKMGGDDSSVNTKDDSFTMDESGELDNFTSPQQSNGKGESGFNSYMMHKGNLTGYTFHWVRRCLRKGIRQNMRFCLQVELSRSMEIDPKLYMSGPEAFQLLKKRNSSIMQNVPDRKTNKTNTSQYNTLKSTLASTASTTNLFLNPKQKRHSSVGSVPRYSLLSNRSSNTSARDSRRDSKRGSTLYDPNTQTTNHLEDPSTPINANDLNAMKSNAAFKGKITLGAHSLFTCSILGPILSRQFTLIWYDIDYVDAVQGICNLLMKNEKTRFPPQANPSAMSSSNNRASIRNSIISTMRTNDSVVSLKSSEVGKYHVSQIASQADSHVGNQDNAASSTPASQSKRRMTVVEIKAQEFEDSRQKQFLSLQQDKQKLKDLKRNHDLFDYFHIAIKSVPDYHQQFLFNTFAMYPHLYLFQYSCWSMPVVEAQLPADLLVHYEVKADLQLAHYIEEARILVPHLLSIPLPCDAMFFTSPLYIVGPEQIAIRCSETMMHILETYGKSLIFTKEILEEIIKNYSETLYALEHINEVDEMIVSQNEELSVVSKQLSGEINGYREELNQIDVRFNKTVDYEHELMIQEDIISTQRRMDEFEKTLEDLLKELRQVFGQFSHSEWKNMTNYFTNKPIFKPMVDVMRAIMIIINYTPKLTKAEKTAAAAAGSTNNTSLTVRLDDDMIARSAVSLLVKSQELINQLCQIVPSSISTVQYNALKVMNTLLNYQHAEDWKMDMTPIERHHFYHAFLMESPYPLVEQTPSIAMIAAANAAAAAAALAAANGVPLAPSIPFLPPPTAEPVVHPIFDIFRKYLLVLELFAASAEMFQNTKDRIQEMQNIYFSLVQEHTAYKQKRRQGILEKTIVLTKKIERIDLTITINHEKLATIQRNRKTKAEMIKSLREVEAVAKEKLQCTIDILQVFLADLCIAVVLLHRVGFLPDHIRQDCLETLRINLLSYNVKMSDTPFVLGSLLDRLQVRSWVQYNETTIANDVPCINSMSLLFLSPFYTMIVDPNGDAYSAISESLVSTDDYEVYTTSGQKFSLTVLDSWIETWCSTCTGSNNVNTMISGGSPSHSPGKDGEQKEANEQTEEKGFCLIITDIQAGVSEDLICFLSAKLHSHLQHIHYDSDITGMCEVDFVHNYNTVGSPKHEQQQTATQESNSNRKQLHTVDLYCGSLPFDPHSQHQKSLGFISIPKKFRLILISTRPPVLDPTGMSYPLPVACMDYITVVFWSINMGDKFIVESSPIQNIMENNIMSGGNNGSGNATTDNRFNYQLAMKFLSTLSPHMMEQLFETNELIHQSSVSLLEMETSIMLKVFISNLLLDQAKQLAAKDEMERVTHRMGSMSFDEENSHPIHDISISLNILADDKLMKTILKSSNHREEYQSTIARKRLLFREYFTFFNSVSDIFSMSSYFLKICGSFLPSECFSPYALTTQAVIVNLLPNVIKYLKKLQMIKRLPVNLYHAYRIVNTIVILQRRLRKFIARKEAEEAAAEEGPPRRISGSGGEVRQFHLSKPGLLIGDESSRNSAGMHALPSQDGSLLPSMMSDVQTGASSGVGGDVKLTNANTVTGLIPTYRYQGSKLLEFQLLPLRTLFLREMVRYIQLTIRPGFENVTKFLLLLMTWSQSEKLPVEEIRAYLSIILQHQQIDSFRFCYYQYIRKPSDGNDSNANTSLTHYYSPSMPTGLRDSANSFTRPRSRASSGSNNELGAIAPLSDSPKQTSRERVYSSEDFMESLPGMANMTHRVTAFRSNNSSSNITTHRVQTVGGGGSGNSMAMYSLSDHSNVAQRLWNEREIIEYGPGIPDGIWFTKLSTKWMITNNGYSVVNVSTLANEKQPFSTGKNLFSDEQLAIAPKNALIRIPIRYYQDSFEIEWLKIRGIRAFSTLNSPALIALGASVQVMEEINRSRQTMLKMPNGYALKKPFQDRKKSVRASQIALSPSQLVSSSSTSYASRKTSIKLGHGNQRPIKKPENAEKAAEPVSLMRRKSSFHTSMAPGFVKPAGSLSHDPSSDKLQYHHKLKIQQERRITTRATALLEDMASDIVKSRKLSVGQNSHRLSLMQSRKSSVQRLHINNAQAGNAGNAPITRSRAGSAIQQVRNLRQSTIVNNTNTTTTGGAGGSNPLQRQSKSNSTFSQTPLSLSGTYTGGNSIHDLVTDESVYTNLFILENHPQLKNIFHGITSGIVKNLPDFEEWKESLVELETIDCHHLSVEELLEYIEIMQPPKCADVDDNGNSTVEEGLWSQGYELTILQSLLLCETLWPFSSDALLNFVYMLIVQYLKQDGFIVLHPDEIFVEDEFDEDNEDDDDDEDEDDEYASPSSSGKFQPMSPSLMAASPRPPRLSTGKKMLSKLIEQEDDEDEEEDGKPNQPSKKSSPVKKSKNDSEEDEEDEEEDGDYFPSLPTPSSSTSSSTTLTTTRSGSNKTTPRSSFFQSLSAYDASLQPASYLQQDNVHIVNSWFKLSHVLKLSNEGKPIPSPQLATPQSSQCVVSNRDFFNYEVVLMEVLSEYFEIDKFVFMKELRDTMLNNKSTYFLTSKNLGCQTSIFSQRAREYALLAEKHIPILYFHANFPTDDMTNGTTAKTITGIGVAGIATSTTTTTSSSTMTTQPLMVNPVSDQKKAYRHLLHEFLKLIKASLASNVQSRKAIIEMLQLSSFVGNAVINSVLLQASIQGSSGSSGGGGSSDHMMMGAVSKVQAYQKALAKQQQLKAHQQSKTMTNSAIAKHLQPQAASTTNHDTNTRKLHTTVAQEEVEYRHWRHSFPLIISSEWNNVNVDYVSPPVTLGELSYAWLPRYFAPDIVNLSTTSLLTIQSTMNHTSTKESTQYTTNRILRTVPENVSIPETCGILYEEMESALLWIMNSSHSIVQTRITQEIRLQLRLLSKTEIRIAASMITFWQIIQYQRNKSYEIAGFSSIWSSCLNSLNLWQLSRLLLKIHEFYEVHPMLLSYQNASLLQVHPVFQQAVLVLMNSFSRLDCDFYHIAHFVYENTQFVEYYQKQQVRAANATNNNNQSSGGLRGMPPHPPTTSYPTTNTNNAFGPAPPSAPTSKSGSSPNKSGTVQSHVQGHVQTNVQGHVQSHVQGYVQGHAGNVSVATTALSSRAMKQFLKQQKKLLDLREKFVHSLDSIDRFRLHLDLSTLTMSSPGTSSASGGGGGGGAAARLVAKDQALSSSLTGTGTPIISLTALEQRLIDEAFMKRMYAFLSTFLANIIIKKNAMAREEAAAEKEEEEQEETPGAGALQAGRRKTIQQVVQDMHRKSQKMNIQSVMNMRSTGNNTGNNGTGNSSGNGNTGSSGNGNTGSSSGNGNGGSTGNSGGNTGNVNGNTGTASAAAAANKWISKAHHLDVQFGNITAEDLIKCMMKWSFDGMSGEGGGSGGTGGGSGGGEGGTSKSTKRLTKSRKSKILVALKRLSTKVQKEREDEERKLREE